MLGIHDMTVKLQVVGIFYRNENIIVPSGGAIVKDVLDAAVKSPGDGQMFTYTQTPVAQSNNHSVTSFTATYQDGVDSGVLHKHYPRGEYFLSENLHGNPYSVWQYYLLDEKNQQVNRNSGVVYFDDPRAIVKDGWTVIWRLVNILSGPHEAPRKARSRFVR